MNGISRASSAGGQYSPLLEQADQTPTDRELQVRETFQDFVAGTFYKQMLKSLRRMHDEPAYFHGGKAEEMFQSQLDQQVAEDLARNQGASFADPMFQAFAQRLRLGEIAPSAQIASKQSVSATN